MRTTARIAILFILIPFTCVCANAQARKRVAILRFDDRSVQTQNMGIGQRVTDELISALAGTGSFEIIDREYLNKVLAEQTQGYGDRFSTEGAAKLGKLANADVLIIGQIDAFSATVTTGNQTSILGSKAVQNGVVGLRGTARVIQVETGTIILAPSVSSEQKAVLAESNTTPGTMVRGLSLPGSSKNQNNQSSLPKLVDQAVHDVATQLSTKISTSAIAMRAAPAVPKFVGIEDGLVVVNKGQNAGIKVGDKFNVARPTDSGLKDPDTGQAIIRKKKQCILTISVVEDAISSGKCEGEGVPQAGDEFTRASSQ
jgi:curli biogenesis system outer membrane secretion channel CsgG